MSHLDLSSNEIDISLEPWIYGKANQCLEDTFSLLVKLFVALCTRYGQSEISWCLRGMSSFRESLALFLRILFSSTSVFFLSTHILWFGWGQTSSLAQSYCGTTYGHCGKKLWFPGSVQQMEFLRHSLERARAIGGLHPNGSRSSRVARIWQVHRRPWHHLRIDAPYHPKDASRIPARIKLNHTWSSAKWVTVPLHAEVYERPFAGEGYFQE